MSRTINNQVTGARFQLPRSNNSTTNTNGSISNNIIPLTSQTVKNDNIDVLENITKPIDRIGD